jgi:chloramphenicol-sensitive protein RarD
MNFKISSNFFAVSAFTVWGLLPLFFKTMSHFSSPEIMGIRVLFSFLILGMFLMAKKKFVNSLALFKNPKELSKVFFSSLLIGANWFLFVYAIDHGEILQTSFGYFISPIISIMLGAFVLKEKMSGLKIIASILLVISVAIQAVDFNSFPWIALIISLSFSSYGLMRKYIKLMAFEAVFYETFFMLIISFFYFSFFWTPNLEIPYSNLSNVGLYLGAGVLTIIPMLLFTKAAQKLEISTLGFIQFISPTIQFLLAALIYNEIMSTYKWISFVIIWMACFLIAYASLNGNLKK